MEPEQYFKCPVCGKRVLKRKGRTRKDEGGKEMKFKSQICTSREQSERLLALGLKKEK